MGINWFLLLKFTCAAVLGTLRAKMLANRTGRWAIAFSLLNGKKSFSLLFGRFSTKDGCRTENSFVWSWMSLRQAIKVYEFTTSTHIHHTFAYVNSSNTEVRYCRMDYAYAHFYVNTKTLSSYDRWMANWFTQQNCCATIPMKIHFSGKFGEFSIHQSLSDSHHWSSRRCDVISAFNELIDFSSMKSVGCRNDSYVQFHTKSKCPLFSCQMRKIDTDTHTARQACHIWMNSYTTITAHTTLTQTR